MSYIFTPVRNHNRPQRLSFAITNASPSSILVSAINASTISANAFFLDIIIAENRVTYNIFLKDSMFPAQHAYSGGSVAAAAAPLAPLFSLHGALVRVHRLVGAVENALQAAVQLGIVDRQAHRSRDALPFRQIAVRPHALAEALEHGCLTVREQNRYGKRR